MQQHADILGSLKMMGLLIPQMTCKTYSKAAASPSGRMDMSMQLSATPAAKTLAVTEAPAAPAAGA